MKYHEANLDKEILNHFDIKNENRANLSVWRKIVKTKKKSEGEVTVGIVGKYISILDSYKSLMEALTHGGFANKTNVKLKWINAEQIDSYDNVKNYLKDIHGILVPGGFGKRGANGKINAIKYAREKKIPYFGICLGMQLAVIEFARNVLRIGDASSTEFGKTNYPIVSLLTEWETKTGTEKRNLLSQYGGTMRLGSYECHLLQNSKISKIYKNLIIFERHRHRYEINLALCKNFKENGMIFTGLSPGKELPEILELKKHPWFFGVQYHPELKSKPFDPHPLFSSFIAACLYNSRLI